MLGVESASFGCSSRSFVSVWVKERLRAERVFSTLAVLLSRVRSASRVGSRLRARRPRRTLRRESSAAAVVVVRDEDELEALGEDARGKIVLFNNPMPTYDPERGSGYGTTVRFRTGGARLASEKGAVACLVRSVTAHSLRSPHTGLNQNQQEQKFHDEHQ